ncbi:uncharacterized protein V2V93DRAFT_245949 [Kockiozyma suomiensis]|uniref:uncharacterized protein n=1 Tax=Kockiozyma suomiensis TaxID=1337062 RepID=UPI003344157B
MCINACNLCLFLLARLILVVYSASRRVYPPNTITRLLYLDPIFLKGSICFPYKKNHFRIETGSTCERTGSLSEINSNGFLRFARNRAMLVFSSTHIDKFQRTRSSIWRVSRDLITFPIFNGENRESRKSCEKRVYFLFLAKHKLLTVFNRY